MKTLLSSFWFRLKPRDRQTSTRSSQMSLIPDHPPQKAAISHLLRPRALRPPPHPDGRPTTDALHPPESGKDKERHISLLLHRTIRRSVSRHSPPLQPELPSVPEEDAAVCVSALSPRNSRPVRTSAAGPREKTNSEPETPCSDLPSEETERESE